MTKKTPSTKSLLGTFSILIGVMIYATYGILIRLVSDGFGAFSQNYVRSIIILTFVVFYMLMKSRKWKRIKPQDVKWVSIWSLSGAFAMVLLYFAFNYLPLGTSYFLFYSTMIIAGMFLGKVLFNESMSMKKYIALCVIFIGLVMVYSIEVSKSNMMYIFAALLAGLFIGTWNSTSKKVSSEYTVEQMLVIGAFITAIVGIGGSQIVGEKLPSLSAGGPWFWILIFSIAELSAATFVIVGFKYLEAQKATLIMPVEVVFATIFGLLLYQESLAATTLVGGALIFIGALLPNFDLKALKKQSTESDITEDGF